MLTYPAIDPVIFSVGPLAVRWYGLTYVLGFAAGWVVARMYAQRPGSTWRLADVDDLIFYGAIGTILGGRIGWTLFYGAERLVDDPLMVFRIWEGGMSFHGGLLGVIIAGVLLARKQKRNLMDMLDFMAPVPCLGIFAVRVANFINGELWGKPTSVPWGFIVDVAKLHPIQQSEAERLCVLFKTSPCVLHLHASQLYEGLLEGLLLFIIIWIYTRKHRPRLAPAGLFLLCYGVFRFAVEFVRIPDEDRGYLAFGWVTTGQVLSTPMILLGTALMVFAYRRNVPSGNLLQRPRIPL